jgi:hypothetical protein
MRRFKLESHRRLAQVRRGRNSRSLSVSRLRKRSKRISGNVEAGRHQTKIAKIFAILPNGVDGKEAERTSGKFAGGSDRRSHTAGKVLVKSPQERRSVWGLTLGMGSRAIVRHDSRETGLHSQTEVFLGLLGCGTPPPTNFFRIFCPIRPHQNEALARVFIGAANAANHEMMARS